MGSREREEHAHCICNVIGTATTSDGAIGTTVFDKSLQLEAFYDFCATLNITPRR